MKACMRLISLAGVGSVESGDPLWDDVALLIQAPESGSTIADATGKTVTAQGNAAVSTALGYPTIYFDGDGDRLDVGGVSDFKFLHNGSSWTVEFIIKPSVVSDYEIIFDTVRGTTVYSGIYIAFTTNGINVMIFRGVNNSPVIQKTFTYAFSTSVEYHVCFEWDHTPATGNLVFYVDGSIEGTGNKTASAPSTANHQQPYVGMFSTSYPAYSLHGHLRALRITEGIRYGEEFTAPDWPLPTS